MKQQWLRLSFSLIVSILLLLGCTKKNLSEPERIMRADEGFKFPATFPPDPGEAGKATVRGIDSDQDGVRDDVQRWIFAHFPNDSKKRAALMQLARAVQSDLLLKHDSKEMQKQLLKDKKAIACAYETFSSDDDADTESDYVEARVLNTKERTRLYLEKDRWFDGMMLGDTYPEDGTACEN